MIECGTLVSPQDIRDTDLLREQLPDKVTIEFVDDHTHPQRPTSSMYVRYLAPDAFPDGPIKNYKGSGKTQGFSCDEQLGAKLTDRTYRQGGDGFRHHDVMHLTLATVTGWSPIIRQLMELRRRSQPHIDDIEDGPRAQELEENILNRFSMAMVDGESPVKTAARLSHEAAYDVRHFLAKRGDKVVHIPPERWYTALVTGSAVMALLNESIGNITPSDTDPTVPDAQKMHSAWLHFDSTTPSIGFSKIGAQHAMQLSAKTNWIDLSGGNDTSRLHSRSDGIIVL
jgi:hypothetical protein